MVLILAGCQKKKDYEKIFNDPNLYCNTVHELNTIVMGNNFSPMVASRNYLYAAVAGYEVIAASNPEHYISLAGQLRSLGDLPKINPGSKNKLQSGCRCLLIVNLENPSLFLQEVCNTGSIV